AEFKGNPKIFEVSIVNSYVCEGTDGKLITRPLSAKRNLQIRSEFWNNSRNIYYEILSEEIKINKSLAYNHYDERITESI
ncbi:hypothetical protein, partial [Leyella stercorea]|uniref:hypothetical protein n=1 Tax=Leyella stercorea TaxID=363265 RepID=UPI00242C8D42